MARPRATHVDKWRRLAGFRGMFLSARVPAQKNTSGGSNEDDGLAARLLLPACAGAAMLAATLGHGAMAQGYAVETRSDVQYAEHDGVRLTGNLYLPKGLDKAPILIAAHGGGWQGGNPDAFKLYGPYLAKHGYAVYAIRYRLAKAG